jgi:hypothetical protein
LAGRHLQGVVAAFVGGDGNIAVFYENRDQLHGLAVGGVGHAAIHGCGLLRQKKKGQPTARCQRQPWLWMTEKGYETGNHLFLFNLGNYLFV